METLKNREKAVFLVSHNKLGAGYEATINHCNPPV